MIYSEMHFHPEIVVVQMSRQRVEKLAGLCKDAVHF